MCDDSEAGLAKRVVGKTGREYIIDICIDPDPMNPREHYDNCGVILAWHGRYDFTDEEGKSMKRDIEEDGINSDIRTVFEYLRENYDVVAIRPLYLYDHTDLSVSTTPFSCSWDSGQLGYIVVTRESFKRFTFQDFEDGNDNHMILAFDLIERDVGVFDKYLSGEQYVFQLYGVKVCECCDGETLILLDVIGGYTNFDDVLLDTKELVDYYECEELTWEGIE